MSLIEQARVLVKGIMSTDVDHPTARAVDGDATVDPTLDPTLELDHTERIRQEWDAQPHHP